MQATAAAIRGQRRRAFLTAGARASAVLPLLLMACAPATAQPPQPGVDFSGSIRPVLHRHCVRCHGPGAQKGGLRLDTRAEVMRGGDSGGFVSGHGDLRARRNDDRDDDESGVCDWPARPRPWSLVSRRRAQLPGVERGVHSVYKRAEPADHAGISGRVSAARSGRHAHRCRSLHERRSHTVLRHDQTRVPRGMCCGVRAPIRVNSFMIASSDVPELRRSSVRLAG